jgi:hypothetical protein
MITREFLFHRGPWREDDETESNNRRDNYAGRLMFGFIAHHGPSICRRTAPGSSADLVPRADNSTEESDSDFAINQSSASGPHAQH